MATALSHNLAGLMIPTAAGQAIAAEFEPQNNLSLKLAVIVLAGSKVGPLGVGRTLSWIPNRFGVFRGCKDG